MRAQAPKSQVDKIKEAARALGWDDDEVRYRERLRVLMKHKSKPVEPKPE